MASDVAVYFCDPRSPWQRGSHENTNRLLRQYLPHVTDLSVHSQAQLNAIARQLNERPRKTLLYRTPAETLRRVCCSEQLSPPLNPDLRDVRFRECRFGAYAATS